MIGDMNQPAKNWLADHLRNFNSLLKSGKDPSCLIVIDDVVVELRLNKIHGIFERVSMPDDVREALVRLDLCALGQVSPSLARDVLDDIKTLCTFVRKVTGE